jgi:hypothetical protein
MAVVNGYTDVSELREHIGDTNTVLAAAVLERAIEAASRAIDRFTGRTFYLEAATSVATYQPDDPYVAWVDDIGTTTGLAVATDTNGDYSWATTWTIGTDFELRPLNADRVGSGSTVQPYAWWEIVAIGNKTFPSHPLRATLRVTARFGWSAVPDDVQEACILKAAGLVNRKNSPNGVAGFGEFGAVRINRLDPDVIALLHPYVRLGLGAV